MTGLFVLLFLISFCLLIIGLFKPRIVVKWGKYRKRGAVWLYYGVGALIFLIMVGITVPKDTTTTAAKGTQSQPSTVKTASTTSGNAPKKIIQPLDKQQMLDVLSFSLSKYNEIIKRYDGLTPDNVQSKDPDWFKYSGDNLKSITKKEKSFPSTEAPAAGGLQNQWLIQADVNSALEQIWQTLSSMNNYLKGNGEQLSIQQNEEQFIEFYSKALNEVNSGKISDIKPITNSNIPISKINWNENELDITKNGNLPIAIKVLKNGVQNLKQVSPEPIKVFKTPWNYYGEIVKITGQVGIVQDYPPGSAVSKLLGGSSSEIVIVSQDGIITDYMNEGSSGDIKTGDMVTLYGLPVGTVDAPNKLGGKTTELSMIGKKFVKDNQN